MLDQRPDEETVVDARELGLLDYIPAVSPNIQSPTHFRQVVEAYEEAERGKPIRCVIAAPVQHGKTTLMTHALAWMIGRHQDWPCVYASSTSTFAQRQSRGIRRHALASGVRLSKDYNTIVDWQTTRQGGLRAASPDSQLSGYPARIICLDDLITTRAEAESLEVRDAVWDFIQDVVQTRRGPKTSMFLQASRWHDDDPSGRAIKAGWDQIHLPAINPAGEALCPWGPDPDQPRDLEFLLRMKAESSAYTWESLFQGNPIPRGARVFNGERYYTLRPASGFRIAIGVDLAYSKKKGTDRWAIVVVAAAGGLVYVLEVLGGERGVDDAVGALLGVRRRYPGAPIASYVSGPEIGTYENLANDREHPIDVELLPARWSKFVRAQPLAKKWNAGKVLVPQAASWTKAYLEQLHAFSGADGDVDDEVDATVSAYDMVADSLDVEDTGGRGFFYGSRVL